MDVSVALVAAVAAPLVTYLVAARRFSGKIQSSDAEQLWLESRSIRDWSSKRIDDLNAHVGQLEGRIHALEGTNLGLVEENGRLLAEVSRLVQENAELRIRLGDR